MNPGICATEPVSDGILVHFEGGLRCYFPADFLFEHVNHGANRVFLDYDPSPQTLDPCTGLRAPDCARLGPGMAV